MTTITPKKDPALNAFFEFMNVANDMYYDDFLRLATDFTEVIHIVRKERETTVETARRALGDAEKTANTKEALLLKYKEQRLAMQAGIESEKKEMDDLKKAFDESMKRLEIKERQMVEHDAVSERERAEMLEAKKTMVSITHDLAFHEKDLERASIEERNGKRTVAFLQGKDYATTTPASSAKRARTKSEVIDADCLPHGGTPVVVLRVNEGKSYFVCRTSSMNKASGLTKIPSDKIRESRKSRETFKMGNVEYVVVDSKFVRWHDATYVDVVDAAMSNNVDILQLWRHLERIEVNPKFSDACYR